MKTIVLYARRNVGMYCLSHLVALGYKVKVITDDTNVGWLAEEYGCEQVTLDTMGEFDLFVCVHGNKIIPKQYLVEGKFVNVHPCLSKYVGKNPIAKYLENGDTAGTVESHYMTEEVDAGEKITSFWFYTGEIKSYAEFYNIALPHYYKCLNKTLQQVFK